MNVHLPQRGKLSGEPGSLAEEDVVLSWAHVLKDAVKAGTVGRFLQGKNIGIVCEAADTVSAAFLTSAATELGATVSHVRPSLSGSSSGGEIQRTARMLGRLYDALEWQAEGANLLPLVQRIAGVPVYSGLALTTHPSARLAERLPGHDKPEQRRRYVLQAVLLTTIL